MKIRVPDVLGFPPLPVELRTRDESTALVKYLKRSSGSFTGEVELNREKVCLTGTGSGRSRIAPSYVGVTLILPAVFCIWDENRAFISGVMKDERTSVWRTYLAWPSRYQLRTRLKSQP